MRPAKRRQYSAEEKIRTFVMLIPGERVRNIVELAAEAGVKRFVHCSTIGVHGHVEHPPAAEDAPIKPVNLGSLSLRCVLSSSFLSWVTIG